MKCPHVSLGQYCDKIGSGVTPRGGDSVYLNEGVALIRSQNIYNANFTTDGLAYIDEKQAEKMAGVEVMERDVLLNITGDSVARCCLAPSGILPARVNQHVSIIRPKPAELDSKFLTYYLVSPYMQSYMLSWAGSGGTRKALTKTMIENFRVPLPELNTQRAIASRLSAYDDLIENNRRRIKLLEEAARLLYREWFVYFRFPGHEHVKNTNGVPTGWEKKLLGDIVAIKKGKNITAETVVDGDIPVVAGGLSPAYYHDQPNTQGPVITISASGANAGYVNLYHQDIWASDCSYISKDSIAAVYHLYLLLKSKQKEITCCQKGAAQPHVYPKDLMNLNVIYPSVKILGLFEDEVIPMFKLISNLLVQNKTLSHARDILLPKLMNGTISV